MKNSSIDRADVLGVLLNSSNVTFINSKEEKNNYVDVLSFTRLLFGTFTYFFLPQLL